MTTHKSFKRLVRARMEKTGESYTAARAVLLAAEEPTPGAKPALVVSDSSIRERTGRGWEEWFDHLDEWGARDRPHKEIARYVASQLEIEPLGWNAQAVTVSYERARGGRQVGEREDGFAISVSKTVAVPVERLYDAFVTETPRDAWLLDDRLRERTATRPKSARFDWDDGSTRVHATFVAKGDGRSTVTVEHRRLEDAEAAERAKTAWRERLTALKALLEAM
jgi:uncharacterized protein YndB with AHSA1/START domain